MDSLKIDFDAEYCNARNWFVTKLLLKIEVEIFDSHRFLIRKWTTTYMNQSREKNQGLSKYVYENSVFSRVGEGLIGPINIGYPTKKIFLIGLYRNSKVV